MSRLKFKLMSIPVVLSLFAVAITANAQSFSPRVGIQLLTSGLTSPLLAGSSDATIARLVLDTTGSSEAVRISSLPFILSTGSGALASTLTNCRMSDEASLSTNLSTPPGANVGLVAGINSINLNSSLILPANTITTLALRCDPSSGLISGGTFTVSMNTVNVSATGVSTGLPAQVTVRGAVLPPITPVPGVPNTGAGGNAPMNLALILSSVGLIALGTLYTRKIVKDSIR